MRYQKQITLAFVGILMGAMQCAFIRENDWLFSEMVCCLGFGNVSISISSLVEFVMAWLPILFFQVWLGNCIYEQYCVSSIFFFSRCTKKVRWYFKEIGKLCLSTLTYIGMMILGAYMLGCVRGQIIWDDKAGIVLFYYVAIYSMWLFTSVLVINVIGILWDNSKSFTIVAGLQSGLTAVYAIFEGWFRFEDLTESELQTRVMLLKINPVSNLVLKWHSNNWKNTPVLSNMWGFEYEFTDTLLILMAVMLAVVIVGVYIIKRIDFVDNGRMM